jgi:enoyl-CoA hydratase/carnithine racemase
VDSGHLIVDLNPPLATVTLNRPTRRNALSLELMQDLGTSLRDVGANKEISVIILAGAGPAFCAGHDLTEMLGRDMDSYRQVFDVCTDLMTEIQRVPQPVIAQVDGMATAAGCQLVASCDLVIASDRARFATPGVRIGLFCSTPMVPLTRAIGRKRALEMLLTGDPIDAATACEWGLVNRVVSSEQLPEAVRELACRIAQASPLVVRIGKEAFYSQIDLDQPKAYSYAKEVMVTNAMAGDAQEGMSAFVEKRSPTWKGR